MYYHNILHYLSLITILIMFRLYILVTIIVDLQLKLLQFLVNSIKHN